MSFLYHRHSRSTEGPGARMSGRYRLEPGSAGLFRIVEERLGTVDIVGSYSVGDYEVRQLNAGTARINPHAIVGCRVEVR
jgi:hypothetical protein